MISFLLLSDSQRNNIRDSWLFLFIIIFCTNLWCLTVFTWWYEMFLLQSISALQFSGSTYLASAYSDFNTCNLLQAGPRCAELVSPPTRAHTSGSWKCLVLFIHVFWRGSGVDEYLILRFLCRCVKISRFDVFISLTFLSDVTVNEQTVQFFWHCCCWNKTAKMTVFVFILWWCDYSYCYKIILGAVTAELTLWYPETCWDISVIKINASLLIKFNIWYTKDIYMEGRNYQNEV